MKSDTKPQASSRHRLQLGAGLFLSAVVAVGFISCVSVQRTIILPPQIQGASFAGNEACSECHQDIVDQFQMDFHASFQIPGHEDLNTSCESCHGPGSTHIETGGAYHTIVNPKNSSEICFQCHLDKQGEFQLPYTHPMVEGTMSCNSCHDVHGTQHRRLIAMTSLVQSENCVECHKQQHGPFVFEHEATRDGCTVCHTPHGSVHPKMLQTRNANLCLKCHFQDQTVPGRVYIGGMDHTSLLNRGTCWTAGCHEAIHGSQVSTSLRF